MHLLRFLRCISAVVKSCPIFRTRQSGPATSRSQISMLVAMSLVGSRRFDELLQTSSLWVDASTTRDDSAQMRREADGTGWTPITADLFQPTWNAASAITTEIRRGLTQD